jgi:hypothetical protein
MALSGDPGLELLKSWGAGDWVYLLIFESPPHLLMKSLGSIKRLTDERLEFAWLNGTISFTLESAFITPLDPEATAAGFPAEDDPACGAPFSSCLEIRFRTGTRFLLFRFR